MNEPVRPHDKLFKVLLAPVISEKSTAVADRDNQAVFKVLPDANKHDIKAAVEQMFGVQVTAVCTVNVKGKNKRFSRMLGKRKDWKKAYVTLAAGQEINLTNP